jgi:response regulator NasT
LLAGWPAQEVAIGVVRVEEIAVLRKEASMYRAKVFLAATEGELRRRVEAVLLREGYHLVGQADSAAEALRRIRALSPEVVILDEDLPGGWEVLRVAAGEHIGAVLLLGSSCPQELEERYPGAVIGLVPKPVRKVLLVSSLQTCLAAWRRVSALEEEVNRLKEKLETRKVVERAKGILMQTLGLSEQEAYRRIQKESMDRCLPMRAIAEAIILANELKGKK